MSAACHVERSRDISYCTSGNIKRFLDFARNDMGSAVIDRRYRLTASLPAKRLAMQSHSRSLMDLTAEAVDRRAAVSTR